MTLERMKGRYREFGTETCRMDLRAVILHIELPSYRTPHRSIVFLRSDIAVLTTSEAIEFAKPVDHMANLVRTQYFWESGPSRKLRARRNQLAKRNMVLRYQGEPL